MRKAFKLKKEYYNKLKLDKEFITDIARPYFIIKNLTYKNHIINVAIPLRSNINKYFASLKDEYVSTPPTNHTLTNKGNVAGWHITKMIPIKFNYVISHKIKDSKLNVSYAIACELCNEEIIHKTKLMLNRLENGEKVFGTIDFDKFLFNI